MPSDNRGFRCSSCGTVAFGDHPPECCNRTMDPVDTDDAAVERPELEHLLGGVFGMSRTELDVCLCIMQGESTVEAVADELDVDRSLVSRHLNHLVDLGVVEKSRRIRRQGGERHVYTPASVEEVQRRLKTELDAWITGAVAEIDDLSREKVEAIAENEGRITERPVVETEE